MKDKKNTSEVFEAVKIKEGILIRKRNKKRLWRNIPDNN